MRYEQLSGGRTLLEDLSYLNTNAFGSKKTAATKTKVKQGWGKRILKKLSMATILGVLGLAAGPGGAALGATIGAFIAGKKFKNAKIAGQPIAAYMKSNGVDKEIEALHTKYFSDDKLQPFLDNQKEIIAGFDASGGERSIDDTKSREDILANTRDYALQDVKQHLNDAGKELAVIAANHKLPPHQVAAMYAMLYGDSPLNYFMRRVVGRSGIWH